MNILFQDRNLRKACNNDALMIRTYGPRRAKILKRRLDELRAAENLEVLRSLPQLSCHELKGDREGTLAVNLDHPYRLIFEPANDPTPRKADGGLNWPEVTVIRVLTVEDYHG